MERKPFILEILLTIQKFSSVYYIGQIFIWLLPVTYNYVLQGEPIHLFWMLFTMIGLDDVWSRLCEAIAYFSGGDESWIYKEIL